MALSILKYVDVVIGFALVMILASTMVSTLTQLGSALFWSRGRYLYRALRELFTQIDSINLRPENAQKLSNAVLRHPMIRKPNWMLTLLDPTRKGKPANWVTRISHRRGTVIKREELIRILLEIAADTTGTTALALPLQRAFGFGGGAADATNALRAIGEQMLQLERSAPNEPAHVRETKAIIVGTWANALVAKIDSWWDQSMDRVTHFYALQAKAVTALTALLVVGWAQLDTFDLLRRLSMDEKFRATLVQEAEKKQTEIDQMQPKPPIAAPGTESPAGAPSVSPTLPGSTQEAIELLKKQKEEIEAAVADLNQPNLAITSQYYRAIAKEAASLNQPKYELTVGTKTYPLLRDSDESFSALADKINALAASVQASVSRKQEGNETLYRITIESHTPNLSTLDLRPGPNGASMVERVETYYPWWNLCPHWKGIIFSWILLNLGAPFWYDVMKNLLRLRPSLAQQEERDRQERQNAQ